MRRSFDHYLDRVDDDGGGDDDLPAAMRAVAGRLSFGGILVNSSTSLHANHFQFSSIHPAEWPLEQMAMTGTELYRK